MQTFIDWIFLSSKDPAKTSLAVRGALLLLVPQALQALSIACGFGLACFNVDAVWFNNVIELITLVMYVVLTAIGGIFLIIGAWRKIATTAKGTNAVLNQ